MELPSLCASFFNPSAKINVFLQNTQVLHYMPGRIRLYSQHLLNNQEMAGKVSEHLLTIPEISDFAINTATGSLLIQYSPEGVSGNPVLRELERRVAKQYGR